MVLLGVCDEPGVRALVGQQINRENVFKNVCGDLEATTPTQGFVATK